MSGAPKLPISPQVGEMAGRPEGGAVELDGGGFTLPQGPIRESSTTKRVPSGAGALVAEASNAKPACAAGHWRKSAPWTNM